MIAMKELMYVSNAFIRHAASLAFGCLRITQSNAVICDCNAWARGADQAGWDCSGCTLQWLVYPVLLTFYMYMHTWCQQVSIRCIQHILGICQSQQEGHIQECAASVHQLAL